MTGRPLALLPINHAGGYLEPRPGAFCGRGVAIVGAILNGLCANGHGKGLSHANARAEDGEKLSKESAS